MNSRERFLLTMAHTQPDRTPVSFADTMASGILECPPDNNKYSELCNYFGLVDFASPDIGHYSNFVSNVDERIRDKFRADFIRIDPNPQEVESLGEGKTRLLGTYCGWEVGKVGIFDQIINHPLKYIEDPKKIDDYLFWPKEADYKKLAIGKRAEAKTLYENSGKVVVVDTFLVFPFLAYSQLAGFDRWLIDMKINQKFYHALCERLLEIGVGIIDNFIAEIGDYIDVVCTYDDIGSQQGMFMSIEDYRNNVKPYEMEVIKAIKKHTDAAIYRHSCGSVYDAIPDFIDMGIEILNPIQTRARNMEPEKLKNEFGSDLVFWGGMDTQETLPNGTIREVKAEVFRLLETLGKNGGYVFSSSTNIEPDTPVENILAMFEAVKEFYM